MKQILFVILLAMIAVSCGNKSDSSSADSGDGITVAGALSTSSSLALTASEAVSASDLSALKMYCVAFNAAATSGQSEFGAGGAFSVTGLPANTPFGCFVVNKVSSAIVATLKITDTATGFDNESSTSMSLGSGVNLGSITLTEGSAVIEVPKTRIAAAQSTVAASLAVDDIHNTGWSMTCVNASDTKCAEFVAESPTVFFRIVKATKSSKNIYGIGIWASQASFSTCGSFDMLASEATAIDTEEGGDFTWVQNTSGTFTNATSENSACALRWGDEAASSDNLQEYYAMEKLVVQGNMFTMNQEDEEKNEYCEFYYKTAVTFSPTSATEMFGSFDNAEVIKNVQPGGCGGQADVSQSNSFVVKFTKI